MHEFGRPAFFGKSMENACWASVGAGHPSATRRIPAHGRRVLIIRRVVVRMAAVSPPADQVNIKAASTGAARSLARARAWPTRRRSSRPVLRSGRPHRRRTRPAQRWRPSRACLRASCRTCDPHPRAQTGGAWSDLPRLLPDRGQRALAAYFCLFRTTFAGFMPSIWPFISSPETVR